MDELHPPEQIKDAPPGLILELREPNGNVVVLSTLQLRQNQSGSWGYFTPLSGTLKGIENGKLRINCHATFIGSKDW